jgi:hypothetical protein
MKTTRRACLLAGLLAFGAFGQRGPAKPAKLVEVVRAAQHENVRESYGLWANECVTDLDLADFTRSGKAARIADELSRAKAFLDAVSELKALDQGAREAVYAEARKPLRPTWEQQGRRPNRDGQTEAGQREEILIAAEVVKRAQQTLARPK